MPWSVSPSYLSARDRLSSYQTFCAIRPRNAEDPRQHYISGRFIHHVPKINADAYGHRLSAIVRALSRKTSNVADDARYAEPLALVPGVGLNGVNGVVVDYLGRR